MVLRIVQGILYVDITTVVLNTQLWVEKLIAALKPMNPPQVFNEFADCCIAP